MNFWALALAATAIFFLILIPIIGALLFKPRHARNVKIVELDDQLNMRHITSVGHPDYRHTVRLDRHPYYLAPHIAVICYAACISGGASLTNNVAVLADSTRNTMAVCFFLGASIVLLGSLLGARIGRWRVLPKVTHHLTSSVLGDDITIPYVMSMAGLFIVSVSMGLYSTTSFSTTTGSLGGWLTGLFSAAACAMLPMLYLRIRRFNREDRTLIAEALARLESGDADR